MVELSPSEGHPDVTEPSSMKPQDTANTYYTPQEFPIDLEICGLDLLARNYNRSCYITVSTTE
jgi:hypothetical protein